MAHYYARDRESIVFQVGKEKRRPKELRGTCWGEAARGALEDLTGLKILSMRNIYDGNELFTFERADGTVFDLRGYINSVGVWSLTFPDDEICT